MSHGTTDVNDAAAELARRRGLRLYDAMVLIGGAALFLSMRGQVLARLFDSVVDLGWESARNLSLLPDHWPVFWRAVRLGLSRSVSSADEILRNLVLCMALAFVFLRLRDPRPPLRTVLGQPGTVAVLAMVFGAWWVAGWAILLLGPETRPQLAGGLGMGGGVIAAWAFLALSRRWRAEPGWVDRMGCWLGVGAIVHALLVFVLDVVLPMAW